MQKSKKNWFRGLYKKRDLQISEYKLMVGIFHVKGKKGGLKIAKVKHRIMESPFHFHPINYLENEKAILQSSF